MYRQIRWEYLILIIIVFSSQKLTAQTSTTTGGNWHTGSTWIGGSVPAIQNANIVINGKVTSAVDLNFNNNIVLTVNANDTLIVNGDLIFFNNADFIIQAGAVVIVRGDFESNNNLELDANAYLIITGNMTLNKNSNLTSTTSPSLVFVGGQVTTGSGTTGNVLQCPGGTGYDSDCNYGNIVDLFQDSIMEVIDVACTPQPTYYTNGQPASNSPVAVGGTINLTANPNPGSGASFVSFAWTGPNGYSYSSFTTPNTSIGMAAASMSGNYVFVAINNQGCFVQDTTYVLVTNCCGSSSYFSKDNYTGNWEDYSTWANPDESWRPLTPPTDGSGTGYSQPLCVNGTVTLNGDLTIRNTTHTVCDTLIVTGDLDVGSFTLNVGSNGVLIVLGNYTGTNGTSGNNGKVIIVGEVNENYTLSGSGDTYIFDPTPTGNFNGGFTSAGDESDLATNDPGLYTLFQIITGGSGISGGEIGYSETICTGTQASEINNITYPAPGASFTYTWYSSTNSTDTTAGTWTIIADSTREALFPGNLTLTTSYFRRAFDGSGSEANSNVVTVTVNSLPVTSIISGNTTTCEQSLETYSTNGSGTLTWSVTGGVIQSGQNTSTVTILWGDLSPSTVSSTEIVTIQNYNGTCTGIDTLDIIISRLPQTGPQYHIENNQEY
ncbi:MAG: hypothetical protein JXJ22_16650 [Bacteroidales bacterium]|nr:hypothetical protein [Bacteroidales bacterium]